MSIFTASSRITTGTNRLGLPPHKTLPVIEAVLITLQRPHLARAPPGRVDLFGTQHAPVAGDSQDPRLDAGLGFERHGLAGVQPVAVVSALEVAGEALADELRVDRLDASEDAGKEGLEVELWDAWGEEV